MATKKISKRSATKVAAPAAESNQPMTGREAEAFLKGEVSGKRTAAQLAQAKRVLGKDNDSKPAKGRKTAAKTAETSATGGRRGRAPAWPLDAKITVLAEGNPKREGTKAHAAFALYAKAKTVGDYLAAGGTTVDLHWDEDKKLIKIG